MPCPLHPDSPRYGAHACRECKLLQMRAYRAARREAMNARSRDYYAANRDRMTDQMRAYHRNSRRVCACGRPVRRTGVRRSFWCGEDCRAACQWAVCEALARGGVRAL